MYVLDSNVYLWVFLSDHVFQTEATDLLVKIDEQILLPHIILSEVLTIVTYKEGKQKANEVLDFLESDDRFVFVHIDIEDCLWLRKALDNKIAHADVVLMYSSFKYGATLKSFDKQLNALYKKLKK